jgi:uncharacterized protein
MIPEPALEWGIAPFPRCPVRFLIDGYNLMHAAGYLASRPKPPRLGPVRGRFLDWLATSAGGRAAEVRVVFDAAAAAGDSPEAVHRGVRVRFAYRRTADDLIEELLAGDGDPGSLAVVSNDGRLHEAARRRQVRAWSCERFVDWLVGGEPTPLPDPPPAPEKPDAVPEGEAEELLRAFGRPKKR